MPIDKEKLRMLVDVAYERSLLKIKEDFIKSRLEAMKNETEEGSRIIDLPFFKEAESGRESKGQDIPFSEKMRRSEASRDKKKGPKRDSSDAED